MILVFALFTLVALGLMVRPFLQSRAKQARFDLLADELRQIDELVSLKSLYLDHLREIEIDHELKKIAQDDYQKIKRQTERAAVHVMRRLDTYYGGRQWQEELDEVIAAHRLASPPPVASTSQAPTLSSLTCAACHAVQSDGAAKFCSQCGATIPTETPTFRLSPPTLSPASP